MARLRGAQRHRERLKNLRLSGGGERKITAALYAAGQLIEIEAERSITEGSISGKGHIPSAPGQPPNADTRLLDTSIETTIPPGTSLRVDVTSNAPYSVPLEVGTSKMAARPYMGPATKKKRGEARALVQAAMNAHVRRS